jgi:hypothetical protein
MDFAEILKTVLYSPLRIGVLELPFNLLELLLTFLLPFFILSFLMIGKLIEGRKDEIGKIGKDQPPAS